MTCVIAVQFYTR